MPSNNAANAQNAQYNLIVGTGSAYTNIAPSATSGVPLISQGAASNPAYGTAVVAGGGTGATSFATTNGIVIYDGTKLVNATGATIDTNGNVIFSSNAAFSAVQSANITNVTGDGTVYTVICNTEIFDIGNNYNNATGIFTAPVTGKYEFIGNVWFGNIGVGNQGSVQIQTTARRYVGSAFNPSTVKDSNNQVIQHATAIADMNAGDTAYLNMSVTGQAKTISALGNGEPIMFFQGRLVQ